LVDQGASLEFLNSVDPGQSVYMDSGTTLKLDKPNSFDGTISFNTDVSSGGTVTIDLPNSSVTSIGYQGDDLTLYHNSKQLATLGRVDKPDPDAYAAEQDEAEKAGGCVIVSRGDTALVLQLAEEAFDPCP
jgi:hypothetical protein